MGMVWLALDTALNERVAIKLLPAMLRADPASMEDVRKEVRLNRQLVHVNIVKVHDLCEDAQEPTFIFMEYVEGRTLTELRLQEPGGVFRWDQLVPWLAQLGDALDHAHRQKIIHRDLKPNNIMVDHQDRVKLLDFGIARVMADSVTRLTMRQGTSGTLPYMSPQQLDGHQARVTDDIYSLGATLYELLTSKPPFYHGDVHYQIRHLNPESMVERLDSLSLQNDIPSHVEGAILSCLQKDALLRPQTVPMFLKRLGIAKESATYPEPPAYPPPAGRRTPSARRTPAPPPRPATMPDPDPAPVMEPIGEEAAEWELERPYISAPAQNPAAWLDPILFLIDFGALAILIYALLLPPPPPPPEPVRVWVTTIPAGASVVWARPGDSSPIQPAMTGAGSYELWPDTYELRVSMGGYEPATQNVVVAQSPAWTNFSIALDPLPVSVRIDIVVTPNELQVQFPDELRVQLGDKSTSDNPAIFNVVPGQYDLSIDSANCDPVRERISVPAEDLRTNCTLTARPRSLPTGALELQDRSPIPEQIHVRIAGGKEFRTNITANLSVKAPLMRVVLPGGAYRLSIDPMEDGNIDEAFTITPNTTNILVLTRVLIYTDPENATLIQNGKPLANTKNPRVVPRIDGKPLHLQARHAGYEEWPFDVPARRNEFTVTLTKLKHPVAGEPWTNSLGMVFRQVSTTNNGLAHCWASIWETRHQDYRRFYDDPRRPEYFAGRWSPVFKDRLDARMENDHPAICITWDGARGFCKWLTTREREESQLDGGWKYRLPSDREWSLAAGLDFEAGDSPSERSDLARNPKRKRDIENHYPFGSWPPRTGVGNYSPDQGVDRFELTAPVGSFLPNRFGVHDLGGNVWEFCEDFGATVVLRGGSFHSDGPQLLRTYYRLFKPRDAAGEDDWGFRVFLVREP